MAGLCQECTACCTVFEIKEIDKAFGQPCKFLGQTAFGGPGCTKYDERPMACHHYICLWLDSQRRPEAVERMPDEMRPDRTGVVMGWPWGTDRETMFVYPLPGHEAAWRKPPVSDHLRMILSRGGKIVIVAGGQRIAIRGDMAVVGTEAEFAQILS